METTQKHWNLPHINQEHSPSKTTKITGEIKKESILIEIISKRILQHYDSTPFLLAYALKPQTVTKIISNMKLPPEDKVPIPQTYPLDLSSSSEHNIISILPGQTQCDSIETIRSPSDITTLKVSHTQLQLR